MPLFFYAYVRCECFVLSTTLYTYKFALTVFRIYFTIIGSNEIVGRGFWIWLQKLKSSFLRVRGKTNIGSVYVDKHILYCDYCSFSCVYYSLTSICFCILFQTYSDSSKKKQWAKIERRIIGVWGLSLLSDDCRLISVFVFVCPWSWWWFAVMNYQKKY